MNDANMGHAYDGLLWTLRSLQELSSVLLIPDSQGEMTSSSSAPNELRDPLLLEMETFVLATLVDKDIEARPLSDLLFSCTLLSNLVHGSYFVRQREGISPFPSKVGQHLLELPDRAVDVIQSNQNDLSSGCFSYEFFVGDRALVTSFGSFVSSPLFVEQRDQSCTDIALNDAVIQSIERLLKELAKGYEKYCNSSTVFQSEKMLQGLSASVTPVHSMSPFDSSKSRIMDLELDVNDDAGDIDILAIGGKRSSGISSSVEKWKFNMISFISEFFSVLHVVTWDILFEFMDKECDSKVRERILYNLCQHPYWLSSSNFTDLYEAAWRAGNWDFSLLYMGNNTQSLQTRSGHYNENLHRCREGEGNRSTGKQHSGSLEGNG